MEELLKQLLEQTAQMREEMGHIYHRLNNLETKLDQLAKMDSIEHRVAVNQIDLSDIKEIVENMETFQKEELQELAQFVKENTGGTYVREELKHIHQRLDAQLLKIARNEEAILMIGEREVQ